MQPAPSAAAISASVQRTARVWHGPAPDRATSDTSRELAAQDAHNGTHRCQFPHTQTRPPNWQPRTPEWAPTAANSSPGASVGCVEDRRVRLVVLFGGRSAEHDVSCVSARHVVAAADPQKYIVEPVGITREGRWVQAAAALEALGVGPEALPERLSADGPEIEPLPALTDDAVGGAGPAGPTVVLPILHGPMGEDGTVQGLLELAPGSLRRGGGAGLRAVHGQDRGQHDAGRGRHRPHPLAQRHARRSGRGRLGAGSAGRGLG